MRYKSCIIEEGLSRGQVQGLAFIGLPLYQIKYTFNTTYHRI